jgi:hypothetical protein
MTNLEKIQALQAGEFDKVLEGTPSAQTQFPNYGALHVNNNALPNAAKIEVTKGVLDEAVSLLEREEGEYGPSSYTIKTLTLLKTLRETL